jgi:hypothetical protein
MFLPDEEVSAACAQSLQLLGKPHPEPHVAIQETGPHNILVTRQMATNREVTT